jgi:hypothetical protein
LFFLVPSLLLAQKIIFQEPLSARTANYEIDVVLDVENQRLSGHELLTWYNTSEDTVTELQFHLYLNAFRNNRSTFMKESHGEHRGFDMGDDSWGFIEVTAIRLATSVDVVDNIEFIQPDDDNEDDRTVFRLPLPEALLPGEPISIEIDFTAKLPEPPFARTGAKEEYFFVGQWFPKIGVYMDGAWNCHQFHGLSEFFADFGVYDVRMTVPEEYIIGATGLEVEVRENDDGTATHYYHAEDVHDFAWAASPEFLEFTGIARDVEIRLLMQPDHADQVKRHLETTAIAIEYIQDWFGDYPYPNLTVVDPRRGAGGSGGMEYPTLITVGTAYGIPEGIRFVEQAIIHEFAHNYWYHLIASNEFEEPWLDEGITSFTEAEVMREAFGPVGNAIDLFGIRISGIQIDRAIYVRSPDIDTVVQRAWEFFSTRSWVACSFFKPTITLTTLQNYLGTETMRQIMRTYADRWRFKHPKTHDFIDIASEVSAQNLDWFFDQALYSKAVLDYSVERVVTREVEEGEGYDFTHSVSNDSIELVTDEADSVETEEEPQMYYSEVGVRRLGEFTFPVEIEVVFENGETIRELWDGRALWKKYRYVKPTKLAWATVDPNGRIPLDINYTNNSRTVERQRLGVNKLAARWLFWIQFLLDQPDIANMLSALPSRI